MKKILLIIPLLILLSTSAFAQSVPGTLTQQSPTKLDAAGLVSTSATSAATITITPPASQNVYITNVEIANCAGAAAVVAAAVTTISTTNLNGAAWTVGSGVAAGLCQPSPANTSFPLALKSATPGTAVTFVLPAFATNQTLRVSAYYYYAP